MVDLGCPYMLICRHETGPGSLLGLIANDPIVLRVKWKNENTLKGQSIIKPILTMDKSHVQHH